MSEFFEFPEPEPEARRSARQVQPPWAGAPSGMVAGVVPVELVLASNQRAAVAITRLAAYPVGFELELVVLVRDEDEHELDPMLSGIMRHRLRHGDPEREMLRFGIEFSDGSKVTNLRPRPRPGGQGPPPPPVLQPAGGGGGGGHWHQDLWIWPLPPPGVLSFVCEWPAGDLELTRSEFDAQLVIDAAGRAQDIFER